MIYYRRYIGAYQKRTTRLSMRDHGAYNLMLDFYYAEEQPLPLEMDDILDICKARTPDDRKSVEKVLRLHFKKREDGYHNERADEEIAASRQARKNGKGGGRPPGSGKTGIQTGDETETGTGGRTKHVTEGETGEVTEPETETQTGTVHPSTFNRSAFQPFSLSTDQPSTDSPAATRPPNRPAAIALLLRELERQRGKAPRITSIDPRVVAWATRGVNDAQLREAYELAVADREAKGEKQAINAGFLDIFLEKVVNPSVVERRSNDADWWSTAEGTFGKAAQIGLKIPLFRRSPELAPIRDEVGTRALLCVKLGDGPWINHQDETLMRLIDSIKKRLASGSTVEDLAAERAERTEGQHRTEAAP